jgi:hypothetical protein
MNNRLGYITAALLVVVILMLGVLIWQLAGMTSTLNAVHIDAIQACEAAPPTIGIFTYTSYCP